MIPFLNEVHAQLFHPVAASSLQCPIADWTWIATTQTWHLNEGRMTFLIPQLLYQYFVCARHALLYSDIFTPPLGGTPQVERRHPPPPTRSLFVLFLMFFNVNLCFAHFCTPQNICLHPPNFEFLEITL